MSREIGRRIAKLTEEVKALVKRQVLAIILDLAACPSWAEPLTARAAAG